MSPKPAPYFVTQLDTRRFIPGSDNFSQQRSPNVRFYFNEQKIVDMRFYSFARDIHHLYKEAHAFLFEQWLIKHREEYKDFNAASDFMDLDMKIIHLACEPSFNLLEIIRDDEEIFTLQQAESNLETLKALPQGHDLRRHLRALTEAIQGRLILNNKDMSALRTQNAVIEIALLNHKD